MTKEIKRTQTCPACGGVMHYEKHDDVLAYKGQQRTIKTLGWWCAECGEGILTGEPLIAHERAFQEFKATVDQVLGPPDEIRVREREGLPPRPLPTRAKPESGPKAGIGRRAAGSRDLP